MVTTRRRTSPPSSDDAQCGDAEPRYMTHEMNSVNCNDTKSNITDIISKCKFRPAPKVSSSSGGGTLFYRFIVTPVCDFLCKLLPSWISPDTLSFLGLCCASAACLCACASSETGAHISLPLAAGFWFMYGILDNLDGKQARRLGLCSAGGDFFDHSSDSLSCSLGALITFRVILSLPYMATSLPLTTDSLEPTIVNKWECIPVGWISSIPFWDNFSSTIFGQSTSDKLCFYTRDCLNLKPNIVVLIWLVTAQIPFFVATWAHPIVGRTILGASSGGREWFSVDEYNLIVLPISLLLCSRNPTFFSQSIWNVASLVIPLSWLNYFNGFFGPWQVYLLRMVNSVQAQPTSYIPFGHILILFSYVFSIQETVKLLITLARWKDISRLLPGVVFFALTQWRQPPWGMQICFFSFLCLEQIAARLKLHARFVAYLWMPVVLYAMGLGILAYADENGFMHENDNVRQFLSVLTSWFMSVSHSIPHALSFFISDVALKIGHSPIHQTLSFMSLFTLFCSLFAYKCIINRRNPKQKA